MSIAAASPGSPPTGCYSTAVSTVLAVTRMPSGPVSEDNRGARTQLMFTARRCMAWRRVMVIKVSFSFHLGGFSLVYAMTYIRRFRVGNMLTRRASSASQSMTRTLGSQGSGSWRTTVGSAIPNPNSAMVWTVSPVATATAQFSSACVITWSFRSKKRPRCTRAPRPGEYHAKNGKWCSLTGLEWLWGSSGHRFAVKALPRVVQLAAKL